MKMKLLIGSDHRDYVEHLSHVLAEKYADTFDVSVCSSMERLGEVITENRYDAVLVEPSFASAVKEDAVRLPLVLWHEAGLSADVATHMKKVRKYQRISVLAGLILEYYALVATDIVHMANDKAKITAVWSPCGGVGKTTVALAYAARKGGGDKAVVYLNLESFASTSAYFPENGKSISCAFERLDSNAHVLLMGIRQHDSSSGITYFSSPDNYDDITILTAADIETLIQACATWADEVIVDLPSQCDDRVQKVFELANTVLLVTDFTTTAHVKMQQFLHQHHVAGRIQDKSVLINNKGAKWSEARIHNDIRLPFVQTTDPISVYKTLSGSTFEW